VFRAFDPDRDRLVAVKLFRLDLPPERVHQLVAEFERLIAAAVTHPAVIAPVATGLAGVNAYLAQDYVVAESLDITLRQGPVSVADALRVATQLAGALDAAAAVHIEHGALHPRDVLLSADGARLTGLGIARAVEHVGGPTQVRRPYTAPERTVGSEWGGRADVFGLAAIIHEMLWARRVAATGDEAAGSLTEIDGGDLPRLRAVFGRALADNPAERFGTALEFAGVLKEAFTLVRSVRPSAGSGRPELVEGRLQPDRAQLQPDRRSGIGSEPRLPLEPPAAVENAEKAVEKEPELVAMRADLDLRLPVLPPELIDSYRPAPDSLLADGQSRSAISPLAFALLIGAALGFVAGFGVGTWGRSPDQSDVAASPTAGPAREFTEAEIRPSTSSGRPELVEGQLKPDPTAGQPDLQAQPGPKPAPPPIIGSLLVRSTPLGARVLVDGREYGRTPLTVSNLSRGEHSVRVIREGYVADERLVTITSAQRAHSVTARLAPERVAPVSNVVNAAKATAPANSTNSTNSPGAAPLTVESRPAGAKVFIDGRLVGTTPLVVPAVTAGEHALYLDRDGYQRWSSAIRIVTTDKNRVTASLDR
jgi:serine/threonine-protein kinase